MTAPNQPIFAARLDHRGLISIGGAQARTFLQGLISQDIDKVTPNRAVYGALLTPQGKFLHEFCIAQLGEVLLLECERARAADLVARLVRFRLRAKIEITDLSERWEVIAVFSPANPGAASRDLGLDEVPGTARGLANGIAFTDPRCAKLGCRLLLPVGTQEQPDVTPSTLAAFDSWRLAQGVPDGSRDIAVEKAGLLEANFDLLNGVDWDKGCYMGQELTARTHYRGLVKRRLVPVAFADPPPAPGTPVTIGDQKSAKFARFRGVSALQPCGWTRSPIVGRR